MGIIQTYFLYFFVLILTTALVFVSEKVRPNLHSKFIFFGAIVIPVVVSGWRYGVGTDYFAYENIYYNLTGFSSIQEAIFDTRFEPGWVLLNYFIKYTFDDVRFLFVISSLLIWIITFKAVYNFKEKINLTIAVFILMSTMFNPSFNIIRQSVAVALVLLSIRSIYDRKLLKFIFTVLLASCFHYTALVFMPVYWLLNSRYKSIGFLKKSLAIILTLLLVINANYFLGLITNLELFSAYSQYDLNIGSLGIGNLVIKLPIIIIIGYNLRRLKYKSNFVYQMSIVYYMGLILEFYGYLADYVGRIALYYEIIQIFILATIIDLHVSKNNKLFYNLIIIIYFSGWFVYYYFIQNNHETIPYMWS